jgi:hypothetical protein
MNLFARWLAELSYILDLVTHSSWSDSTSIKQLPLFENAGAHTQGLDYGDPVFEPPSGPKGFTCDYSAMADGWKPCSTPQNRGCWLRSSSGEEYNITTDYEKKMPIGITRHVIYIFLPFP